MLALSVSRGAKKQLNRVNFIKRHRTDNMVLCLFLCVFDRKFCEKLVKIKESTKIAKKFHVKTTQNPLCLQKKKVTRRKSVLKYHGGIGDEERQKTSGGFAGRDIGLFRWEQVQFSYGIFG